jgi:hypothetical protein
MIKPQVKLHLMGYVHYGSQMKMKYTLAAARVAAKENQMNLLLMFLQAFHVKCAIRNFSSREELKQHAMQKHK